MNGVSGSSLCLSLLVSVLLAMAFSPAACGMLIHPCSHRVIVNDGRHVLVFVSPLSVEEDTGNGTATPEAREILEIRRKYTQSGLYRNDGSTTPLWTMPYCSPHANYLLAPDCRRLVVQDWNPQNLMFFDTGAFVRQLDPAMIDPNLRLRSFFRLYLLEVGEGRLDAETGRFVVPTSDGEMVFDITTGRLVSSRSVFTIYLCAALAATMLSFGGVLYFMKGQRDTRGTSQAPLFT